MVHISAAAFFGLAIIVALVRRNPFARGNACIYALFGIGVLVARESTFLSGTIVIIGVLGMVLMTIWPQQR